MSTSASSSKNFIPMANKYDRIVLLVDMDCFYCQVEEKLDASLKDQPLAVVQYNTWRGGGIIAVNYAARAKGVKRHMRGDEAKAQCPEIRLIKVPNVREKADLTKYREAGKDVANILQRFTSLLERASIDEAYLDITESVNKRLIKMNEGTFVLQPTELVGTYAVGFETIGEFVTKITTNYTNPLLNNEDLFRNFQESDIPAARSSNIRLLIGASIASEIRAAVKAETSYECSAGIAHNKILAKLACGMNKPNKQTLLPLSQIDRLFETLPVGKIKGLGAKYGEDVCERLGIRYLGQLLKFTETELQRKFEEKNGSWLYNICRGIDLEAVTSRFYSKSIGCCKKFPGRNSITGIRTLRHWLKELSNEIGERLEIDIVENNRRAKQMVVSFIQEINYEEISSSRSAPLSCYDPEVVARISLEIIKSNTKQFYHYGSEGVLHNPIKFLGISVGKFETISHCQNNIQDMFAQQAAKIQKKTEVGQHKIIETSTSCNAINMEEIPRIRNVNKKNSEKTLIASALMKQTTHSSIKNFPEPHVKEFNSTKKTNRESEVPASSPKSFFKKHLKNVQLKKSIIVTVEENASSEVLMADRCLNSTVPTKAFDISDEPDGFINDMEIMQNESDNKQFIATSTEVVTPVIVLCNKRKFTEISEIEPSCSNSQAQSANNKTSCSNYKVQYAEFSVPEFQPKFAQNLVATCLKCSAKIPKDPLSLQTHKDHHFAQELCHSQRLEFREQVRSKINAASTATSTAPKKSKKSPTNISRKNRLNENIIKYLRPSLSSSVGPKDSETEICEICKIPIKLDAVVEHKDFHFAKDLQRKLNQLEVHTVEVAKKPFSNSSRGNFSNVKPIKQFLTHSDT